MQVFPPVLQEPWWAQWPIRFQPFTSQDRDSQPPHQISFHPFPLLHRHRNPCLKRLPLLLGENQLHYISGFSPSHLSFSNYAWFCSAQSMLHRWVEKKRSWLMSLPAVMTVRRLNKLYHTCAVVNQLVSFLLMILYDILCNYVII